MTTIFCDGTHLAWDSRLMLGSSVLTGATNKSTVVYEAALNRWWGVGTCGVAGVTDLVLDWYLGLSDKPVGEWEAIIVGKTPNAAIYLSTYEGLGPNGVCLQYPVALGSGAAYALGSYYSERDVLTALKAAGTYDSGTGGPYKVWEIGKPVDRKKSNGLAVREI